MKKTTLFTVVILAFTAIITSCSKDEEKKNNTANLTAKDWKLASLTANTAGIIVDIYNDLDACEKDNLLKFNTDGTILEKAGATKCDPSEPDTQSGGVWAFLNNETKLRIIDGDTIIYDITTLNGTSAVLTSTNIIGGTPTILTMSLKNN